MSEVRLLFENAKLVLSPGEMPREDSLLCIDGKIAETQPGQCDDGETHRIDCGGDYLAPGFIDLHCHGAIGRDAMEAREDAFRAILSHHADGGTTTVLLSTVSASLDRMLAVLEAARGYSPGKESARLAGIHLEGPYFSRERQGAHDPRFIRNPTPSETSVLLEHSQIIRRVTLAPEVFGCLPLARDLASRGITASAGHSDATHEEALAGFAAGISQATHLYNCMSSLHKSSGLRKTGLAEAALTTRGILCEVIPDGFHVPSTLLRLAWLAKGWEGIAIVTDATAGSGLPEGSEFDLGGIPCRIENGSAWTGEQGGRRLAGSCITMIEGIRTMVEEAGVPLAEAVAMASLVPARSLGEEGLLGSLKPGKRADLVRFSKDWKVRGVWVEGVKISSGSGG